METGFLLKKRLKKVKLLLDSQTGYSTTSIETDAIAKFARGAYRSVNLAGYILAKNHMAGTSITAAVLLAA